MQYLQCYYAKYCQTNAIDRNKLSSEGVRYILNGFITFESSKPITASCFTNITFSISFTKNSARLRRRFLQKKRSTFVVLKIHFRGAIVASPLLVARQRFSLLVSSE